MRFPTSLAFGLVLLCLVCRADDPPGPYSGGAGTVADPYQIATKADLLALSATPGDYGKHFILTADIDLAGETFTTAVIAPDTNTTSSGFQGTSFTGTFDGGGHVVRNLTITVEGPGNNYLGLFGRLGFGTQVGNLGVEDVQITGDYGSAWVGGLCGLNESGAIGNSHTVGIIATGNGSAHVGGLCGSNLHGTIESCHASGTVTTGFSSERIGGLCGGSYDGAVLNCYASVVLVAGRSSTGIGGLCGHNYWGTVQSSYATGTVRGGSGMSAIGGLCGSNDTGGTIIDCYATGTIATGSDSHGIGGLCGGCLGSLTASCYAIGSIETGSDSSSVGGLCGSGRESAIHDCYFSLLAGPDNGVGEPLDSGQLQEAASFAAFDFTDNLDDGADDFWAIVPGHCPKLAWQTDEGPLPPSLPTTSLTGSGTSTDPFVIANATDFAEFCGNASLSGGYYSLASDIDLEGATFSVAVVDRVFGGVFEGNRHTIRNLTISVEGSLYGNLGLFAVVSGTIRNLGVEQALIMGGRSDNIGALCGYIQRGIVTGCSVAGTIAGRNHVGGLCGYNDEGTITDCCATAAVTGMYWSYNIGGLCGTNHRGAIRNSHANGTVANGDSSFGTGGLCGWNRYGTIEGCYATGRVTGEVNANYVGGLCGVNGDDQTTNGDDGTITNCYATGTVGALSSYSVGGLCGRNTGTIRCCYAIGHVEGNKLSPGVGGLCGDKADGIVNDCYFCSMRGPDNGIGVPLDTGELQSMSSFAGFDFVGNADDGTDEVWSITVGHCPRLDWQEGDGPAPPPNPATTLRGSGTESDPFVIADAADFTEFCGNRELRSGCYSLANDIDLAGRTFAASPIDRAFGGVFEGNGHVIRNLTVKTEGKSTNYLGVFAWVSGTVRDLGVMGVQVVGGPNSNYVGGLSGYVQGGTISGCYVTGTVAGSNCLGGLCGYIDCATLDGCYAACTVTSDQYSDSVGGLCGYNNSGTVDGCYVAGTTMGDDNVGGLCGYVHAGTLSRCYATGAITGTVSVGGLCGFNYSGNIFFCHTAGATKGKIRIGGLCGQNYNGTIADSYSTVSIVSDDVSSYAGGLCGDSSGTIIRCYASGAINGIISSYFGGFCGKSNPGTFSHCFFNLFGGPDNGIGEPLDAGQFVKATSFPGFDFVGNQDDGTDDIWAITEGHCPRLAWEAGDGPLPPAVPVTSLAGSGTAADPFVIAGTEDFREFCDNNRLVSGYYALTSDIDLAGTTLATAAINRVFGGAFDGNGHVVRNITIDTDGAATYGLGLFSSVHGTVRNLGVGNVQIACGPSYYVGGLCGQNYGVLTGCWTTGSITGDGAPLYLGGLCGYSNNGTITGCHSSVSVAGGNYTKYAGGLCGLSYGAIRDCYATGSVTGGNSSEYLGGLCGGNGGGNLEHCYATGSVTGGNSSSRLGGLCGGNGHGNVERCYATGSVTGGDSSTYLGGMCGNNDSGSIANCYSRGPVAAGSNSKGIGSFCGSSGSGTVTYCYAGGKVTVGTGSSYASGFSGYGTYDAIVGCFWDTTPPESDSRTGGTGKTTAAMQTQATFTAAGWDFVGETANGTEEIWYMRGYPALRVFATVPIQVLDVQNGSGGGGYEEGTFVTVAADEPAEGQEFASWTVDPTEHATNLADATAATTTFTIPAAAVTLTATYVTKTYTVRFDLGEHGEWTGGGDLVQTVAHGTAAVAPEFSVEDGWVFTGWNKDISAITANLAVTAFYVVLDTDNDYLPDKWEYQHFGNLDHNRADDPDRDGFTNWEEFVAGTHPDDNQSYPRDRAALVWQDAVQKLRVIGRALERYMADHGPDALPGRLMYLVDQGYLDADMLLTIGDKSGGTDPHPYEKSHFAYVYEAGVSFFYETSESLCPWTIPGYSHTPESTWYDVKMYQFAYTHGYTFSGQPYDRRAFPVVACLWMTDSMVTPSYWTRLNLALDCRTVFASPVDAWEDLSDIYLPDDPAVLRPLPSTPIVARYTVPLHIPLWFAVKDVASTHGLRLVPSGEARDGAVIGEIRDLYYVLTPDIDTPTAFTVTVEWDDGTGAAQRASFAIALDSGPDDDPDDDGLSNAAELAANTDPYDSESRLTVFFEQTTASVSESAGTVAVRCLLSGPSALPVAVDYAAVGGTATGGGTDYALASETLVFAAGETAKDIEVVVIDDELSELTESLQIALANPANVVFGSRILFTLDITDNDPHTVTYLPGLHGALPGGEPAIVLVVEYGHPVPPPPAVVPEAGWTHVGWEWTPGTRSVGPVAVTQDWTATARYAEGAPAAPSWQLDLALGGATPATLTLGMRADATDGWDAGIDGHAPPPAPGQPCLAADDFALFYSADYRAPAATAEFLLLVDNPEEEPVTISWHPPALPDHKFLSIYEAILDDLPSGRDAIARRPVGYSALDMAATASLEVPAGASRSYVIRYGDELVFDLPFRTGWNLISLPLEPLNRAVGVALEDAPPGNLDVQNIWSLARGKYAAAAELHPCIGYWVYAAGPTVLLVKGTPVAQNGLKLEKGFNLRGVATACPAPVDNRIRGGIWRWDAATMRYVPVTALQPGHGYWFQATRNAIIHLPRH